MNIENLLKEIEIKKQEIAKNIPLHKTNVLKKYYEIDSLSILIISVFFYFLCAIYFNKSFPLFITLVMSFCLGPLIPLYLNKLCPKRNLSLSYRIKSFFQREKIEEICRSEKRKEASNQQLDKDFLTKIALNMHKEDFKCFLKECNSNITLRKLEEEIACRQKTQRKADNIDKLTEAIYNESQNLLLGNKGV